MSLAAEAAKVDLLVVCVAQILWTLSYLALWVEGAVALEEVSAVAHQAEALVEVLVEVSEEALAEVVAPRGVGNLMIEISSYFKKLKPDRIKPTLGTN